MKATLEGGKIEEVADERLRNLPIHPISPLLRSVINKYNFWLTEKLPADLYQEVAAFLLEECPLGGNGNEIDYDNLSQKEKNEIINKFSRRLRQFIEEYGLKFKKDGRKIEKLFVEKPGGPFDPENDMRLREVSTEIIEDKAWYDLHLPFCQKIILHSEMPDPQKAWEIFKHYVSTKFNTYEIGKMTGVTEKDARRIIEESIMCIRKAISAENLPGWEIAPSHNIKHKDLMAKFGITSAKNKVEVTIDPAWKITEIQERFGVSKDAAMRMRKSAKENDGISWYYPDYHPKGIIPEITAQKVEVPIDPSWKIAEIRKRFGVGKHTATRMRRVASENGGVAWYYPDYHSKRKSEDKNQAVIAPERSI